MSFLTRNLKQKITLWGKGATKDAYGNLSYNSPRVIKGRWEDGSDLKLDLDGREINARVKVFLKEDVNLGDYLFLGIDTTASPVSVSQAFEVRAFMKTPTLGGKKFERIAVL